MLPSVTQPKMYGIPSVGNLILAKLSTCVGSGLCLSWSLHVQAVFRPVKDSQKHEGHCYVQLSHISHACYRRAGRERLSPHVAPCLSCLRALQLSRAVLQAMHILGTL